MFVNSKYRYVLKKAVTHGQTPNAATDSTPVLLLVLTLSENLRYSGYWSLSQILSMP
jgi:hypothetical protein